MRIRRINSLITSQRTGFTLTLHMTDEEAAGFAQALWQGRAQ